MKTMLCGLLAAAVVSAGVSAFGQAPVQPLHGSVDMEVADLTNDVAVNEELVRENPDDPEAHFLLGIAYSRTPYLEKALSELRIAKKLAKKRPEGYALFDRKIREFENLLLEKPDDPLILYRLAFGYYMRGYGVEHGYIKDGSDPDVYYARAEKTMTRLTQVAPDDIWAKNYLGFFLIEQNETENLERAIALWEDSVRMNADNPGAYMLLGEAYMKQGNLKKAVESGAKGLAAREAWLANYKKSQ